MSKTTKLSLIALTGFAMLISTGCQMVHVKDQAGNPINWAAVSTGPEGKKASSLPTMTNFLGDAALPKTMTKEREIIQVSKDGYETKTVHRSSEDKVTITLYKIGTRTKPRTKPIGYQRPPHDTITIDPKTTSKTPTTQKTQP